ncbi:hypothetical protein [uncultured Clostridium sp.]|uniref:hypothetical protein n=1 Tax=uncultured Clostridium sp. TaxID=59620 RepID=UPI0028F16871|nr:hypothetical protein [uncultured Clostridium sp.]
MFVNLSELELESIENLITDRISQLRTDMDGDAENEEEFRTIIREYKKLLETIDSNKLTREKINSIVTEQFNSSENSDKKLKDVLPQGFENILKVYIYNNKDEVLKYIKDFVEKDSVKDTIRREVNNMVGGLNLAMRKFINVDSICNNIINGIQNYVENEDNSFKIIEFIYSGIDIIKEKDLKEVLSYIPYEGKKTIINFMTEKVYYILDNYS